MTSNRPREVLKQKRSRTRVEALLEATARVLIREATTTIRIAEESSGYGVSSLCDCFPDKEAFVAALFPEGSSLASWDCTPVWNPNAGTGRFGTQTGAIFLLRTTAASERFKPEVATRLE